MAIRVVFAEDSLLLREGIGLLFSTQADIDLVATCVDGAELLQTTEATDPDVVVTDIRMPPTHTDEGIRAAAELRARHPTVGVVVLSQYAEPSYARKLFMDGADRRAYLLKERIGDVATLFDAVRVVHSGGSVLDPKIIDLMLAGTNSLGPELSHLSRRELEVLGQVAQGKSNIGIAKALFISERAVEKHINATFTKLDLLQEPEVNRRVLAARLFLGVDAR